VLLIPQVTLPLLPLLYGLEANHLKRRDRGKRHPNKSLKKKRKQGIRGILIGAERLMFGSSLKLSTCCQWKGDYKLEPELFGGER
jgi:hypothetical protein